MMLDGCVWCIIVIKKTIIVNNLIYSNSVLFYFVYLQTALLADRKKNTFHNKIYAYEEEFTVFIRRSAFIIASGYESRHVVVRMEYL